MISWKGWDPESEWNQQDSQCLPGLKRYCGWVETNPLFSSCTQILVFPRGSVVKNSPAMWETQETQVRSLDWEDPLERKWPPYSRILVWRIPWTEEPGGLQSMGSQKTDLTYQLNNNKKSYLRKYGPFRLLEGAGLRNSCMPTIEM